MSPQSDGLFRAAISESGGLGATDLKDALANTATMGKYASCTKKESLKACMQGLTDLQVCRGGDGMEARVDVG